MPTDMWNIQGLFDMISGHLDFDDSISSAFSSWTHYMETAAKFSDSMEESRIAVLDTRSLKENVYFSVDLWRAALCEIPYKNEFLIFGPISGPDYYTVSTRDLCRATRIIDIHRGNSDAFGEERISSIERGAVEASKEIATFLQPPGTSLENIVILTAKFVAVRVARSLQRQELEDLSDDDTDDEIQPRSRRFRRPRPQPTQVHSPQPRQQYLSPDDMRGFLYYIRDDLQELAMQKGATRISLVEPNMDTSFCRDLVFEVQLQQAAQNAVHVLC